MRVIFITTDVIEILMMGGTLKLENFHPKQIGKLFLYMQLVLGILGSGDIGAYFTHFLSVVNLSSNLTFNW